jgi:hypothetical protein
VTTYYDIVPNRRIVSRETVETAGKILLISMSMTLLEPEGAGEGHGDNAAHLAGWRRHDQWGKG